MIQDHRHGILSTRSYSEKPHGWSMSSLLIVSSWQPPSATNLVSQVYPDTIMGHANRSLHSEVGTEGQVYVVVRSEAPRQFSCWCPADDKAGCENPHAISQTGDGDTFLGAFAIGPLQRIQDFRPPVMEKLELASPWCRLVLLHFGHRRN